MSVREAAAGALQRLRRLVREPLPELPDEGSRAAADTARPHQRQRTHERPGGDGLRLALRVDLEDRPELEGTAHRLRGSRTDDDRAGLGGLLEPGRNVHRVARDERAALAGTAGHHLFGVDSDPQGELLLEELAEAPLHRERRVQGALRMVLLRLGDAEHGHDGVTGELLDCAAGPAELSAIASEKRSSRTRVRSGSSCSPSAVEPTRSANSTMASCARRPPRGHCDVLLAGFHLVDMRAAHELRDPDDVEPPAAFAQVPARGLPDALALADGLERALA